MSNCSTDPDRQPIPLTRRAFIAGSAASLALRPDQVFAAGQGERLYADVLRYQGFGHHRTGSRGDVQTSRWIGERLHRLGFSVDLQPFAHELFEPDAGSLDVADISVPTFPLWPVTTTVVEGARGRLTLSRPGSGEIAFVRLPYAPNASLASSSYAEPITGAVSAGPVAVIGVTEGPTGEVIALNVPADAAPWPMPVALIGSRHAERLMQHANAGDIASLRQRGRRRAATAHNVVARRPGRGPLLIVSAPTSGWFTCAGERGAGIALFLALAEHCAARHDRPLLFLATSGHEFEGKGSHALLAAAAPDPSAVGAWFHIGANVAGADIAFSQNGARRLDRPYRQRGVGATGPLLETVTRRYTADSAYSPPVLLTAANAVGDIAHYLEAGYNSLMGVVGAHPLHHTDLDRAALATTPRLLLRALNPLRGVIDDAVSR